VGKKVSETQLAATNAVHDAARELTPPIASGDGTAADGAGIHVTPLQNVLFGASADVIRRFRQLPEGAPAFIGWTDDLIEALDKAVRDEPWHLIGGLPPTLGRLREILVGIRDIAGNVSGGTEPPAVKHLARLRKARPQNALRLVGSIVAGAMSAARARLAQQLTQDLAAQGVTAEVRV